MKHLVRVGGLLSAVVGVTALSIALPKFMSVPEVMHDYGLYGGGDNSEEWAGWTGQYADHFVCDACHADKHRSWAESKHSGVSCESCHGPGKSHIDDGTTLTVNTTRAFCELCHAEIIGRPDGFPQIDAEMHGGQSACVTCHDPHETTFRVSESPAIPHSLEGIGDCLQCHGIGEMKPFPQDHEGLNAGTCFNCHESE